MRIPHLILPLGVFLLCLHRFPVSAATKPPPPQGPAVVYSVLSAIAPGESVDVTWYGESLGKPLGLWTNFAAQVTPAPLETRAGEARYRITAAADVPVGVYGVRLMTSAGASNLRLLLVDDLPTVLRKGNNTTVEHAQPVSSGVAIDGACEPLAADYYRIAGKKDQRIAIEAFAQRMGSRMDPMIRLLDATGSELVYCDDSPGAGSDCRFSYTFPADGDYTIELRDVNYEGGAEYRYLLRVGDFPIVTNAFPLSGKHGAEMKFQLEGSDCESLKPIAMKLPADKPRIWIGAKFPQGVGSALVPVMVSDLEDISDVGYRHSTASPVLGLPFAVSGHFQKPREAPAFAFAASSGQKVAVRGFTRSIGSSAHLSLQLLASDGKEIAASKVVGTDDGSVEGTIPADGTYLVRARELSGDAGPGMYYRLEVRPVQPGFALSVETEQLNVAAGGSTRIKVTAARRDYTGPISLALTGDAEKFELLSGQIAQGKNETELEIKVPSDAPTDRPLTFGIVGTATIGDVQVTERASTMPALQKLFPRMQAPPAELDGIIGLGVRPKSK